MKIYKSIKSIVLLLATAILASTAAVAVTAATPTPLQSLQLSQPFTIAYKASGGAYTEGTMSPVKLSVTLSYDGVHLLYRTEELTTHVTHTVLYDGKDTYEMDSNSPISLIEPGFDFSRMQFCPLPAVGIPHMPLFISGFQPQFAEKLRAQIAPVQSSEPKYINMALFATPGQARDYGGFAYSNREAGRDAIRQGFASAVSILDTNLPKVLWYDTFDNVGPNLGTVWEFYKHKKFEGLWLATKAKMRLYVTLTATHKNTLFRYGTYDLVAAVDRPMAASAYDPATYLGMHSSVTDMTGPIVRAFIYQAGKGPLQTQRGNGIQISEALAVNSKSKTNSGLVGLVALIIVTAIWFLWRRNREA